MNAIKTFNNTNSELKRTINIAFECILQRIEEASKVGKTYIQEDFQSTEIRDGVRNYLEEKGYLCISLYDFTLYITWDMSVMRVAYYSYKEYMESYVVSSNGKITAENISTIS
jgi:hypothetical protein